MWRVKHTTVCHAMYCVYFLHFWSLVQLIACLVCVQLLVLVFVCLLVSCSEGGCDGGMDNGVIDFQAVRSLTYCLLTFWILVCLLFIIVPELSVIYFSWWYCLRLLLGFWCYSVVLQFCSISLGWLQSCVFPWDCILQYALCCARSQPFLIMWWHAVVLHLGLAHCWSIMMLF